MKRFWGSILSMVLGALIGLAGVSQTAQGITNSLLEAGVAIFGGGFAYYAIKKRRMGIERNATFSIILELVGISLPIGVILLGASADLIEIDPVPILVIPLLAMFPYFLVLSGGVTFKSWKPVKSNTDKSKEESTVEISEKKYLNELEELKRLKDKGVITEEEFRMKKKKILDI